MKENSSTEAPQSAIHARGLRKTFGWLDAVSGIDLDLPTGSYLTIFGPNGAGKTTLIKILAGLTKPTAGTVTVAGYDVLDGDPKFRGEIGVISHASCLYPDLTPLENLVFHARMYGLENPKEKAEEAIEAAGLQARINDRVRTFSRGMQQRISLARATIHNPSVLLLDEPFTGLDPRASNTLKEYLHSLHHEKRTILMTTHDISLGLEMGDTVAILVDGRFAFWDKMENLDSQGFESVYFQALEQNGKGKGGKRGSLNGLVGKAAL